MHFVCILYRTLDYIFLSRDNIEVTDVQVLPRLILPISAPSSSSTTNAELVVIIEQDECIDADTPLCEDTGLTVSSLSLVAESTNRSSQTVTAIIDQDYGNGTTNVDNATTANEVTPVPSLYELVLDQPQPSAAWPSDHLMIIADIRLI